jgi:hypothetical protein
MMKEQRGERIFIAFQDFSHASLPSKTFSNYGGLLASHFLLDVWPNCGHRRRPWAAPSATCLFAHAYKSENNRYPVSVTEDSLRLNVAKLQLPKVIKVTRFFWPPPKWSCYQTNRSPTIGQTNLSNPKYSRSLQSLSIYNYFRFPYSKRT